MFRWPDFLSFGLFAIIMTCVSLWITFTPALVVEGPREAAIGLCWLITVAGYVVYGIIFYSRRKKG